METPDGEALQNYTRFSGELNKELKEYQNITFG